MDWQQIIALLIVAATVAVFVCVTIRNRRTKSGACGCTGCESGSGRSEKVRFAPAGEAGGALKLLEKKK